MSDWASNKEDKMLFENWRSYLAEQEAAFKRIAIFKVVNDLAKDEKISNQQARILLNTFIPNVLISAKADEKNKAEMDLAPLQIKPENQKDVQKALSDLFKGSGRDVEVYYGQETGQQADQQQAQDQSLSVAMQELKGLNDEFKLSELAQRMYIRLSTVTRKDKKRYNAFQKYLNDEKGPNIVAAAKELVPVYKKYPQLIMPDDQPYPAAAQPAAQEEEPPAPSTVEIKPLLNKFATFIQRTGVLNEKINDVIQALDLKDTKVFGKSLAQNFNREEIETLKSHFEDTENGALFFKQYFSQDPEFLKRFKQILAGEEEAAQPAAQPEEEPANSGQVTDEELENARQKGLEGLSFQSRSVFKKSRSYDPDIVGVDKAMENFDVFQKDGSEDRFRKQIDDPSELKVYEAWIEGFREYIKRLETFEYKLRGDDELEPDQQRAKRNLRAMWTKQHRDLPPQQFDKDLAEFINFVGPYVSGEIDNLNESNRLARTLRKFGKFAQQAGYEGNRMYGALRKLPDTHGAKRIVNSFGRYSKNVNEINFIVQNLFPAIEFSSPKKIQQTLQENKQLDRWKLLAGIK